jgi:uncharacterized damage-inducible protein DinB
MTDEERRILSYFKAQGAKLSPAELVDKVRAAMERLREALDSVPAQRFNDAPAAGEWSANEVMAHVVASGARFCAAIERILDGAPGGLGAADTTGAPAPERSAADWWEQLVRDRSALFERMLGVDPNAQLDCTIDHPNFGPLNWRETLLFLRVHDLDHAGQLEKIAAALR